MPSDGVTNWKAVTPENRKKIGPIVRHYMKDPHPFTACVRDNTKRFGPERAKRICAVVKDMGMRTTKWRKGGKKLQESVFDEDAYIEAAFDSEWAPVLDAEAVTVDELADWSQMAADAGLVEAPLSLAVELGELTALLEAPAGTALSARGRTATTPGARRTVVAKKPIPKPTAKTRSGGSGAYDEGKHPRGRGGAWTIKQGASGDDVRTVQRKIGAKADGHFGAKTTEQVKDFQRKHGLLVDGIVGHQTATALAGHYDAARSAKVGGLKGSDKAKLNLTGRSPAAPKTPKVPKVSGMKTNRQAGNPRQNQKYVETTNGKGQKVHRYKAPNGKTRDVVIKETALDIPVELGDLSLLESFDEHAHPRGRGGKWIPKVGDKVRINLPNSGPGVLTHTVERIDGDHAIVKKPGSPSLGGGKTERVPISQLVRHESGGSTVATKKGTVIATSTKKDIGPARPSGSRFTPRLKAMHEKGEISHRKATEIQKSLDEGKISHRRANQMLDDHTKTGGSDPVLKEHELNEVLGHIGNSYLYDAKPNKPFRIPAADLDDTIRQIDDLLHDGEGDAKLLRSAKAKLQRAATLRESALDMIVDVRESVLDLRIGDDGYLIEADAGEIREEADLALVETIDGHSELLALVESAVPADAKFNSDGTIDFVILRPCAGKGRGGMPGGQPRLYEADMLRESAGVWAGVSAYDNHESQQAKRARGGIPRPPSELAGEVRESWWDPDFTTPADEKEGFGQGAVIGRFMLTEDMEKLVRRLPRAVKTSVNAMATSMRMGSLNGKRGLIVEGIRDDKDHMSVDLVTKAGAGGQVASLYRELAAA